MLMSLISTQAIAGSHDVYRQAVQLAGQGQDSEATSVLTGAAGL